MQTLKTRLNNNCHRVSLRAAITAIETYVTYRIPLSWHIEKRALVITRLHTNQQDYVWRIMWSQNTEHIGDTLPFSQGIETATPYEKIEPHLLKETVMLTKPYRTIVTEILNNDYTRPPPRRTFREPTEPNVFGPDEDEDEDFEDNELEETNTTAPTIAWTRARGIMNRNRIAANIATQRAAARNARTP